MMVGRGAMTSDGGVPSSLGTSEKNLPPDRLVLGVWRV